MQPPPPQNRGYSSLEPRISAVWGVTTPWGQFCQYFSSTDEPRRTKLRKSTVDEITLIRGFLNTYLAAGLYGRALCCGFLALVVCRHTTSPRKSSQSHPRTDRRVGGLDYILGGCPVQTPFVLWFLVAAWPQASPQPPKIRAVGHLPGAPNRGAPCPHYAGGRPHPVPSVESRPHFRVRLATPTSQTLRDCFASVSLTRHKCSAIAARGAGYYKNFGVIFW